MLVIAVAAGIQAAPSRSSAQGSTRSRPGVLPPVEHNLAINDHVFNSLAVLKRLIVGRLVYNLLRVEQREVGETSGPDEAAVQEAEFGRVERSHLAHGVL